MDYGKIMKVGLQVYVLVIKKKRDLYNSCCMRQLQSNNDQHERRRELAEMTDKEEGRKEGFKRI